MVNWERIEQLRDHLVELDKAHKRDQKKHRKFNMRYWMKLISGKFKKGDVVSIERVRKNGASCGFAACLAGDTVLLFGGKELQFRVSDCNQLVPNRAADMAGLAEGLLGLDFAERQYMFFGRWSTPKFPASYRFDDADYIKAATHSRAIKYLTRVLEHRTIFVKWDGSAPTVFDTDSVKDHVQTYNT